MKKIAAVVSKVIIALVLVYSFVGFFILPYFIQFYTADILKKTLNTDSYIDSVHLNPFNFHIRLDNFIIKDEKHKNLLFFEKFIINIDPLKLLKNKIVIKNIKLENMKIDVDLDKDKRANFQYIIEALNGANKTAEKEGSKKQGAMELVINKLDLNSIVLVFTDYSKKEPFNVTTRPVDLSVKDIELKPGHINNLALNIDTFDTGKINLSSQIVLEPLSAKGKLELSKINLNKIFNYVKTEEMNFGIDSSPFDLGIDYEYKSINGVQNIDLSNIVLNLSKIAYMTEQFDIEAKGMSKSVDSFNLAIGEKLEYKGENILSSIKELAFKDKKKSRELAFGDINSSIKSVTGDKNVPIVVNSSLNTPSKGSLDAKATLLQEPLNVDVNLSLKDMDITPYKEYVKDFANLEINTLYLNSSSDIKIAIKDEQTDIEASSDLSLKDMDISNSYTKQQMVKVKELDIKGLKYKKDDLYIKDISIDKPYIAFYRNDNDTTNYSHITKGEKKNEEKEQPEVVEPAELAPVAQAETGESAFKYQIDNVTVKDGSSLFMDNTVNPSFKSEEEKIQVSIKNISSDKSALTTISHKGIIDKYATLGVDTKLFVSDPLEKTDAELVIENIDLPSLSSYSGKYIGNKIDKGKFALNVNVKIDKGQLQNKNKIKIKDMELGEKVESKDAIDAPVGLAIALLKDSRGYIDLDIPIDGNVKDPAFHIGDVITDVITNTIVGIVAAPFKFLALIVGIEGDDMSKVEFVYGKDDIGVTQREKLDSMLKAFKERPNLKLIIKPAFVERKDNEALGEIKFRAAYKELFNDQIPNEQKFVLAKEKFIVLFKEENYKKLEESYKEKKADEFYGAMVEKLRSTVKVEENELNELAKNRAQSIKDYLMKNKLEENRIVIKDEVKLATFDSAIDKALLEFEVDVK